MQKNHLSRRQAGAAVFLLLSGVLVAAFQNATPLTTVKKSPANTFSAGVTDLMPLMLFQNVTTGEPVYWTMNGANHVGPDASLVGMGAGWILVGAADVTGDGLPDLIWQRKSDGLPYYWTMKGTKHTGPDGALGQAPGTDWRLVTAVDITGDGIVDLIWQNNTSGLPWYWTMNRTTHTGPDGPLGDAPGTDFQLVGVADMNLDGQPDLIWEQRSTYQASIWGMNRINHVGPDVVVGSGGPGWTLMTVADVTADGQTDLLWQYEDGTPSYWVMQGTATTGNGPTANPGADWRVVGMPTPARATQIVKLAGDGQIGNVNLVLTYPLAFQAFDVYGNPADGSIVNFAGSVAVGNTMFNPVKLDANGVGSTPYILGTSFVPAAGSGAFSLQASVGGIGSATFQETGLANSCNSVSGWTGPVATCSPGNPCFNVGSIGTYANQSSITTPSSIPVCHTDLNAYPSDVNIVDKAPATMVDIEGTTRYYCESEPTSATTAHKVPLVIFMPGTGGSADDIYNLTLLRAKSASYQMAGSAGVAGFHVIGAQSRNLHDPTGVHGDAPKWDIFQRDFTRTSKNADIRWIDALIDQEVAGGHIDPKRIYVMGWSNGGHFAELYAFGRNKMPTPQGNYVAAVAIYSAGDPYQNLTNGLTPSCQKANYGSSTTPLMVVSRSCDIFACSQDQATAFLNQGQAFEPSMNEPNWMAQLSTMGDPNVQWKIIKPSGDGATTTSCMSAKLCTWDLAFKDHLTWPDGFNDKNMANDHEAEMLTFLGGYTH